MRSLAHRTARNDISSRLLKICFCCNRPLVDVGKNPQKYVRYQPEDLERMLGEFFEGKNLSEPKR